MNVHVKWNVTLPILQTIRQVEVKTIVKAAIPEKLFESEERMVGRHLSAVNARALLDSELRARFVVQTVFIFRAIEAI